MNAAAPALTFDAEKHLYLVDGQPVPSVTQVLEDVGMIDYSFLPEGEREFYLRRGTAVHLACEYDDQGDLDEASLPEHLRPYLEAWRAFRRDSGFVWDRVEFRSYHPRYGYAGTLDRQGNHNAKLSTRTLVDIKTTQAPSWTRYQLAAYAAFFESPRSFWRMAVELHNDGTYGVHEYPCADWQADFNTFLAALTVFQAKRRKAA